jgi:regulator of cell morphogenesis and NO signaling
MSQSLAAGAAAGNVPHAAASSLDTPALIDLIESRYHAVHRRELPELASLARRVEAVHAKHPDVPAGLADLLDIVADELDTHMQQEEQVLFPLMRQGFPTRGCHSQDGHSMIAQPIAVMMADHYGHGVQIRRLEALTNDFTLPEGACAAWCTLYTGGQKLVSDLTEHIDIENNILFARFVKVP